MAEGAALDRIRCDLVETATKPSLWDSRRMAAAGFAFRAMTIDRAR
jgi:hypothetical protein